MNEGHIIFTDDEGRDWGYVSYFYGFRDFWVCLNDPSNPNIPAFNPAPEPSLYPAVDPPDVSLNGQTFEPAPEPSLYPAVDPPEVSLNGQTDDSSTHSRFTSPMFVVTLVSLVAMLSLLLIGVIRDRKKK